MDALGWVDLAMMLVMGASVIVGLWRGFVFEVLALLGWVAAYLGAQWLAPELAPRLPVAQPGSAARFALAFVLCFVVALLVWALLAKAIRLLLHATPLSVPDRVLGAGFGVLRGGVLLLALATIVALTPAAQSTPWQSSVGARWLDQAMVMLRPALPPAWSQWLGTRTT